MPSEINRREFLKVLSVLPLVSIPPLLGLTANRIQNDQAQQPNIVLIVFDALSARHMSLYSYSRETTPHIDRFAQQAAVFHQHYAGGNYTTTGTASLLTGVLPWKHRAFNFKGGVSDIYQTRNIFSLAPTGTYTSSYSQNRLVTVLFHQFREYLDYLGYPRALALADLELADILYKNDYYISYKSEDVTLRGDKKVTGSLFMGFFYRWLAKHENRRLFNEYKTDFPGGFPQLNEVYYRLEDSIDWIIKQLKTMPQPYLAYYHLLPPHEPYHTRQEFNNLFNDELPIPEKPESFTSDGVSQKSLNVDRRRYDRFVAYADAEFGRLVKLMQQAGMFENTSLVLTSDHGELFERGIRGHTNPVMYEPVIHIPLVISQPGHSSRRDIYEPTSCVDVLPTVLKMYGRTAPEWCEGQALPIFEERKSEERIIYSMDSKDAQKEGKLTAGTFMARRGKYKFVHYLGSSVPDELYDIAQDPEELENLTRSKPELAAELLGLLREEITRQNAPFR